jgi:D-threo-aldose 1-dehydrogenase
LNADPIERRRVGGSDVTVSVLGLGGAPLGNLFRMIEEETALATLEAAHRAGIAWFDTAPFYGHGVSEHRFGHVLRTKPRESFTLSTKVGRLLRASTDVGESPFAGRHQFAIVHDYTYDATMRSIEDSWQRLGMNRIDIALVHDVDRMHQGEAFDASLKTALDGACRALSELRDAGVIGAFGIGVNEVEPCMIFGRETDLDCTMLARCYTLLEQDAVPDLLDLAEVRDFSVLVAGPFASGVLAAETTASATHNYAPVTEAAAARVARLREICAAHGVPLKAAALAFPLRHPRVAAVAAGAVAPAEAEENAALVRTAIPDALWSDLAGAGLIDARLAGAG